MGNILKQNKSNKLQLDYKESIRKQLLAALIELGQIVLWSNPSLRNKYVGRQSLLWEMKKQERVERQQPTFPEAPPSFFCSERENIKCHIPELGARYQLSSCHDHRGTDISPAITLAFNLFLVYNCSVSRACTKYLSSMWLGFPSSKIQFLLLFFIGTF